MVTSATQDDGERELTDEEMEQAFQNTVNESAYSLGDDGTSRTVLIENNTGERITFLDREAALSFLLEEGPVQ